MTGTCQALHAFKVNLQGPLSRFLRGHGMPCSTPGSSTINSVGEWLSSSSLTTANAIVL